jgi:hypothetical protein
MERANPVPVIYSLKPETKVNEAGITVIFLPPPSFGSNLCSWPGVLKVVVRVLVVVLVGSVLQSSVQIRVF